MAVPATFQFITVASCLSAGIPDDGSCGRIQKPRFLAVIFLPLNVLPISRDDTTAFGGSGRSINGTRSG